MIRRNKLIITNMLAVCAIAGMLPQAVYASDVKRIDDKDGYVNSIIPYKDGKYVFDGQFDKDSSHDDDDDYDYDGVYYYDSSYKQLEDEDDDEFDSGADMELFGDKYVILEDGDYYIDLSTGKVSDDDIAEDYLDDAETALKRKVKKVDRYDDYSETPSLTLVNGFKYSEPLYEYNINGFNGYTDKKGNYVDADYDMGTVYVVINGHKQKFNDTDETKTVDGKKYKLAVSDVKTLTHNSDYVYRLATISLKEYNSETKEWGNPTVKVIMNAIKDVDLVDEYKDTTTVTTGSAVSVSTNEATVETQTETTDSSEVNDTTNGTEVTDTIDSAETTETTDSVEVTDSTVETSTTDSQTSMRVIQKISLKQSSGDIDDAKYPSSVDTYELITKTDKTKNGIVDLYSEENISFVGKKLISWKTDGDEVEVQVLEFKTKNGVSYLEETTSDSEDFDAIDTDVDGNLWRLDSGNIYKFDNDEDWDKVYKTDGAMSELSVYDKENLAVWDEDEAYAIVSGKSSSDSDEDNDNDSDVNSDNQNEQDQNSTVDTSKVGWVQNADGTWNYYNEAHVKLTGWVQSPASGLWYFMNTDGVMESSKWINDNGAWYYLTESGAMKTGWLAQGNVWYYLKSSGAMATGWLQDTDGQWYYLYSNGAMAHDTTIDGYSLGSNGAWIR